MSNITLSPRPTMEQVVAMLNFMEKHPTLALGKMKGGVEARAESKKLWLQLSRTLNTMTGPTRTLKSWIKFWSDKKSNVKIKVNSSGGNADSLLSNVERRIWDLFLCDTTNVKKKPKSKDRVRDEDYSETDIFSEEIGQSNGEIKFEPTVIMDYEQRQAAVMKKLVRVLGGQAGALCALAHAASIHAAAAQRLADSSHQQARAMDRLATTFEQIGASTHDVSNAVVDMDVAMKRFYGAPT